MAITTPNLGLRLWNLPTDPYNSGQLADNFARLDEHDHTNGKGLPITTEALADGCITAAKLAPGAISVPDTLTVPDNAVTTAKILDGAVTTAKIADGNVTRGKIAQFPHAKITRVTNQSIATNSSGSKITFTASSWDTDSMWNGGSPTQLTINTAGLYAITAEVLLTSNFSSPFFVELALQVNTATVASGGGVTGSTDYNSINRVSHAATTYRFSSSDILELRVIGDITSGYTFTATTARLTVAYLTS